MLLHQGALAFELWTHLPAPLAVMRAVLEES
jgi:shikimate 5-dehydrogenase